MLDVARHFFARRRGQALHRPARALQDEPPAPAPLRRSGLAHRDQVVAEADATIGGSTAGRRRCGRILHAGRIHGHRRLRGRARFITIVPEIDMPGHTNAALASYPELNCDGQAPGRCTPASRSASARSASTKDSDLPVHRRRRSRNLSALTPGAVLPYRRRRSDRAQRPRAVPRFIERVQAHRRRDREADDRMGRDRARDASARARSCSTGTKRLERRAVRSAARRSILSPADARIST